jgi:hypothetical protein
MSNRNISWGSKGGRCVGQTTLPLSRADCLEIWEPQLPGKLRACPGPYRNRFTLIYIYFGSDKAKERYLTATCTVVTVVVNVPNKTVYKKTGLKLSSFPSQQ